MKYDSRGFYVSPKVQSREVFSCFGTKLTGDGKDPRSAVNILKSLGLEAERIVYPIQTHSKTIADAGSTINDHPDATDGLVASESSVALTVITADCVPVIYYNSQSSQIGISHQGWRGLRESLPRLMVKEMGKGGGEASVQAAIGPAIGGCCFEVGKDVYDDMCSAFRRYDGSFAHIRDSKYYLSLNRLCYLQLLEGGIIPENIDFFPFCTKCNDSQFYSYRREGNHENRRMFSIIIKKAKQ